MRSQDSCFWIILTNLFLTPLLYFKSYNSYSFISMISCLLMIIIFMSIICSAMLNGENTDY